MKQHILAITALAVLLATSGCQKEDDKTAAENAPAVPPIASMSIDFSQFPQDNNSTTLGISAAATDEIGVDANIVVQPQTVRNFTHAAVQVAGWSTLLKVGLVVPVAAFVESFRHVPTLRSDDTWVWSYTVRVDNIIHTAELHGTILSDVIQWEMYVTKPGHYLDFNWFSGISAKDGNSGSWLLRETPENPVPLLDIQWSRDLQKRIASVSYTNVRPGVPENGAFIAYGIIDSSEYDAYFDIYQKEQDNMIEVEWNRISHAGRVSNPNFFGDAEFHYWNGMLQDI